MRPERIAQRTQQSDPAVESGERIPVIDLEYPCNRFRRQARKPVGVGPQRLRGVRRERARSEQVQARDPEALGPRELDAGLGLPPPPHRPGSRIEEHARDREVEADARPFGTVEPFEQGRDPIDAAGLEMPPAAVKGDVQRRVVAAHFIRDVVGGAGEPLRIEDEVRENSPLACGEQLVTALAYRSGLQERGRGGVRLHRSPARGPHRTRAEG